MQIWVKETMPNEVSNHNQISIKWRKRENHMGKTLLQKEMERLFQKIGTKKMIMKNTNEACRSCKALSKVTTDMKNLHYNRT